MNLLKRLIAIATIGLSMVSGVAMAEEAAVSCATADTPEQLEGQVVKVDVEKEKITLRDTSGKVHEFFASKETLQEYKPGDTIKAKLRCEK
jgi:Cu/Ag efflux protein CusF